MKVTHVPHEGSRGRALAPSWRGLSTGRGLFHGSLRSERRLPWKSPRPILGQVWRGGQGREARNGSLAKFPGELLESPLFPHTVCMYFPHGEVHKPYLGLQNFWLSYIAGPMLIARWDGCRCHQPMPICPKKASNGLFVAGARSWAILAQIWDPGRGLAAAYC